MRSLKFDDCFELKEGDKGDLFQQFVYELLRKSDYPKLHRFSTKGKDGGIDLVQQINTERIVVECKYIGEETIAAAKKRWQEVKNNLENNLSGIRPKEKQYSPWYKSDYPIVSYIFCISSEISNLNGFDEFKEEINSFFKTLGAGYPHLKHLGKISVEILDWNKLLGKLDDYSPLKFSWFPLAEKLGFIPIERKSKIASFRSFLEEEKLPFYKRSEHLKKNPNDAIPDEEELLTKLDTDSLTGLIITGNGGAGKTRLTFELGLLAREKGWSVFRCKETLDGDDINNLPQIIKDNDKVLLMLDYIETQQNFAEIIENINIANDFKFHLRYVSNCRTSYYPTIKLIPSHEQIPLTSTANTTASESIWIEKYQESVINHILEKGSIDVTEKHLKVCKNRPILAVFILYLHQKHLEEDLKNLLQEQDFGTWIFKRLRMSFAKLQHAPINFDWELAKLVAMFPFPKSVYANLGDTNRELLKILANDGWIEESENNEWRNIHDVFADQILLSYLQDNSFFKEDFVRDVFSLAYSLDCLESAFISLQRLAPYLKQIDWENLIKSEINKELSKWIKIHHLILESSLLEPLQKINLLQPDNLLWENVKSDVGFQNRLGWLIRWVIKEYKNPLNEAQTYNIKAWLKRVLPNVSTSNFILNWGLRFAPEEVKNYVLNWIITKPATLQTQYMLVVWLELKFPTSDIENYLKIWLSKFEAHETINFVFNAWLDAKGEIDVVRDFIIKWLAAYQTTFDTQFVYKSWLNAGGEIDVVQDSIKQWLGVYQTTFEASHVYKSWLDAKGEIDLIRDSVKQWLNVHHEAFEAQFVYTSWLNAKGEIDLIRDSIKQWLSVYQEVFETRFVYTSWLNAKGDVDLIRDFIIKWLGIHHEVFETRFVYTSWLNAKGDVDLIRDFIIKWLSIHHEVFEARFVYTSWLDAKGDVDLIRDSIKQWLNVHHEAFETRFVYTSWLNAKGDVDLIRDFILKWLSIHRDSPELSHVYKAWLSAKGEIDVVRDSIKQWLGVYQTTFEAQFVYTSWLDAGGEIDLVRDSIKQWLNIHRDSQASHVYKSWLNAKGEIDLVRDSVKQWLDVHQEAFEAQFVYDVWLDAGGEIDLVRDSIKQWLGVNEDTPEASHVYKSWLDAQGEKELIQTHLEKWLIKHGVIKEADFVMRAWLDAKGDFNVIRNFALKWLAENYTEYYAVYLTKELAKQSTLPLETINHILRWCEKFHYSEDAIWRITQLGTHLLNNEISQELIEASEKVISSRLSKNKFLHLKIKGNINEVFYNLYANKGLQDTGSRKRINNLFLKWLKYPDSFEGDLWASFSIQKAEYFTDIIKLLKENLLEIEKDYDALKRFLQWVNNWSLENKESLKPLIQELKQKYPSNDLWETVEFTE